MIFGQSQPSCKCISPHLPFCSEALLADLTVLRVFRVVYFEVKPQGAQLLEALVTLAAVEALLLWVHLNNQTMKSSPLEKVLDSPPPGAWSDHSGRQRTCCSRDRPAGGSSRGFSGLLHAGRFLGRVRRRKGPGVVRCCLWRSLFRNM